MPLNWMIFFSFLVTVVALKMATIEDREKKAYGIGSVLFK